MSELWNRISGIRYAISDMRYLMPDIRYPTFDIWNDIWHLWNDTWHPFLISDMWISGIGYLSICISAYLRICVSEYLNIWVYEYLSTWELASESRQTIFYFCLCIVYYESYFQSVHNMVTPAKPSVVFYGWFASYARRTLLVRFIYPCVAFCNLYSDFSHRWCDHIEFQTAFSIQGCWGLLLR